MKLTLLIVAALLCHTLLAAPTEVALLVENDHPAFSFWGSDRGYTNGMAIYFASAQASPSRILASVARRLSWHECSEGSLTSSWGLGLGQQMFTPEDLDATSVISRDRPYAGWLHASLFLNARSRRGLQVFLVQAGVVGPASGAAETQRIVHGLFGFKDPRGWDNQLRNEPGVMVLYQQRARWIEMGPPGYRSFDVSPAVTLAAGNVMTYLGVGGRVRVGYELPDDFGQTALAPVAAYAPLGHAPSAPVASHFYAFLGAEARLFAHNIFLEGNTFADSHRVAPRPLLLEVEAGLALRIGALSLMWRYVQATPAFIPDTRPQFFGAFQVSYRFD